MLQLRESRHFSAPHSPLSRQRGERYQGPLLSVPVKTPCYYVESSHFAEEAVFVSVFQVPAALRRACKNPMIGTINSPLSDAQSARD